MAYAIISLGGKQYRVQAGERLLVDRLATDEGKTLNPTVLMLGGDGDIQLAPQGVTVTARVVQHVRGEKIRIGKYKKRTGYRRHTGFRAALSQIEIEAIGGKKAAAKKETAKPVAKAPAEPKAATAPKADAAPKGLPKGYAELTVAEVTEGSKTWNRRMLEAALAFERANANRKGAVTALEAAIAKKEEG
jgi:large subunit ribosomal protein L21